MARINYLFTSSVSAGHGQFSASGWEWRDMDSRAPIDDFRPLCAHSANFKASKAKASNLPTFSAGVNCSKAFQGNFAPDERAPAE